MIESLSNCPYSNTSALEKKVVLPFLNENKIVSKQNVLSILTLLIHFLVKGENCSKRVAIF